MEYRRLGRSGLQVSVLSFGSWLTFGKQISDEQAEALMVLAYDKGVNFFDNAEIYARGKSELVMGNILSKLGWERSSFVVSSKVFFGDGGRKPNQTGLNRKHVVEASEAALKRLQVDYLDLFFRHRPDKQTPIEETVRTMNTLIQQGKILYWGTSEWSAQEIMEAHMVARQYNLIGPVMEQPQYNMLHRHKVEVEFSQIYKTVGLGTTIWSPLASGLLTGKYNKGLADDFRLNREELSWLKDRNLVEENLQKIEKVVALAREAGLSPAQFAIAWCLENPNVSTVILGASKEVQLKENLGVLDKGKVFTPELMETLESILQNKPEHPPF